MQRDNNQFITKKTGYVFHIIKVINDVVMKYNNAVIHLKLGEIPS